MPRIFKGSESTLRLLISKTGDYQALTEIKIKLYTTDIENAIEIIDGIQVCKNIAIITLAPRAFMGMEDGLINYIIDGATEDDVFHTERQSNYMLKSLSYINEDGIATQTMTIESNGEYRVTPNDGLYVDINVNVPDLNGSYDDGFNVGYSQGKTDGVNEQKSKLETINITQNGTYTKEDGYNQIEVNVPDLNGSYDEGKTDGINEQKSKLARIEITENGTYTKEDGYNHIEVNVPDLNGSYDVGYGQGKTDGVNEQKSKLEAINITQNGTYTKEDGYNQIEVNVPDLNGSYDEGKTDGINEQKSKLVSINITQNGTYTKEDGYNQIEVNVNAIPKINIQEAGINFALSTFTEVPEWADFSNITDMDDMFKECINLQTIPQIDTSNVTAMSNMFYDCHNLQTIALLNTSNAAYMNGMFGFCINLQTIPSIDTSNVTNMNYMFEYCSNLQTIPQLNTSNVTGMISMFDGCLSLTSIPALNAQSLNMSQYSGIFGNEDIPNLTDFGGFLNLKCSLINDGNLKRLPNLTYQSCINVLNGLYDFVAAGETPNNNQGQLKVHQNFLDKVGNEISIGTSRGWTITV